jgi:hypothetical protein
VKLPPQSPNLNAYAERFVRSTKESCLDRLIWFGEASLRKTIRDFVLHYREERNQRQRQSLVSSSWMSNVPPHGNVRCRQRFSGLLKYYTEKRHEDRTAPIQLAGFRLAGCVAWRRQF